jgi:hypothetical protein
VSIRISVAIDEAFACEALGIPWCSDILIVRLIAIQATMREASASMAVHQRWGRTRWSKEMN